MILALDPSTKVIGWAVLNGDMCNSNGVLDLGKGTINERCWIAFHWLSDALAHGLYETVAIEIPVYHKNQNTFRKLCYVSGALRAAAFQGRATLVDVVPSQRRAALGVPVKITASEAKRQIIQRVNSMFNMYLTPGDHDIADAIAVGVAAQGMLKEMEWDAQ